MAIIFPNLKKNLVPSAKPWLRPVACPGIRWFSNETDLALYQIPGYKLISIGHHASIKGGLVIYLHDSWNFKIVHSNKNSQIWESLIIEISNPCNGSAPTIILGNIYRPPKSGRNELDTLNTEFNQVLLDLQSNTHMVYVAGDFNINLLAVNDTQFNSDYFDSILAAGYMPTITLPTRLSQNNTLIDNIFTNNLKDFTAVVLGDHISDHQASIVSADAELYHVDLRNMLQLDLKMNNLK